MCVGRGFKKVGEAEQDGSRGAAEITYRQKLSKQNYILMDAEHSQSWFLVTSGG